MNNDNSNSSNEITLKDIVLKLREFKSYLLSKWKTIVFAVLTGSILGLTYSLISKPTYSAEMTFALQDDNSSKGGLSGALSLASQFGIDLGTSGGGAFTGDNLLELMKSRSMVENTLLTSVNVYGKQQTLAELYISFNKLREKWEDIPEMKNIKFLPGDDRSKYSLQQDSILGTFFHAIIKKNLSVDKLDRKLSIITVKVDSKNELFSKYFTEILVKNVSDFYVNTKIKRSAQNVNILQHQTDSVRQQLNEAISGVASSSDVNPNPNPSLQIIRVPSQRKQVDVQANIAILTELVKNLELSKMSLRKETPLVQVIDRPILPLEVTKFGKLKGIVLVGFIFGFIACVYLVFSKFLKDSLK